jgi:hypothetical protein
VRKIQFPQVGIFAFLLTLHRPYPLRLLLGHHPAPQQVRVQSVRQSHCGDRYGRLSAGRHDLRLELRAMRPPTPPNDVVARSVHVSTKNLVDTIILSRNRPSKMTSPSAYYQRSKMTMKKRTAHLLVSRSLSRCVRFMHRCIESRRSAMRLRYLQFLKRGLRYSTSRMIASPPRESNTRNPDAEQRERSGFGDRRRHGRRVRVRQGIAANEGRGEIRVLR